MELHIEDNRVSVEYDFHSLNKLGFNDLRTIIDLFSTKNNVNSPGPGRLALIKLFFFLCQFGRWQNWLCLGHTQHRT